MVLERCIHIEGQACYITISDECEALSDAKASGRAILGVWSREMEEGSCPAGYIIEEFSQINDRLLECVLRRHLKLPWTIAETPWLTIREFTPKDASVIKGWRAVQSMDVDFSDEEALNLYCANQYPFYEYGIWAVTLREDKRLIGMAGLTNLELADGRTVLELGYHIDIPFRKKGYAKEACLAILEYADYELQIQELYIRTDASNKASVRLAESLGFQIVQTNEIIQTNKIIQTNNAAEQCLLLYERNCS